MHSQTLRRRKDFVTGWGAAGRVGNLAPFLLNTLKILNIEISTTVPPVRRQAEKSEAQDT